MLVSTEEAKKIYEELKAMFDDKETQNVPYIPYYPPYIGPYYYDYTKPYITCDGVQSSDNVARCYSDPDVEHVYGS